MKKIIAVILTICLVLTAFPLIAAADSSVKPAALQKKVFFADYAGQFSYAYLYGWEMENNYFIDTPYEWPGIMMDQVDFNDNGGVIYAAVLPYNINYIIINDNSGRQTVEIPTGERVLVTLTGEVDEDLHYQVNVRELSIYEMDPTLPYNSETHPEENDFRYLDKLYEQDDIFDLPPKELINDDEAVRYDELYYHTDQAGNTDWALVYLYIQWGGPDVIVSKIIGGRQIYLASPAYPFTIRYAVYDVEKNDFYNLADINNYAPTDVFERYDGLYEVWQTLDLSEISPEVLYGDANGDRSVDIVDATYIQRYLVSMVSKYDIESTAADYDKDGEISVLDVTRIQRALVGMI